MIFETFECEVTRCKDTCPLFFVCAERVSDRNCPKYCPGRKRDYPIDFSGFSETEFEPIKIGDSVFEAQLETVIVKFCGYGCQKGYPDAHSCECGIDSKVECEYNDREGRPKKECPIYDLPSGKYEYKMNKEDIIRTGDCYED